ncbi:hypothetical protein GRI38_06250 [Altererythrobacter aurantiacus]|uniref:TadE-like domain-containing protein n=2 Tax=Parapontixanthobacter aurantiacus TaxID=1463599 RepID=A0A844ZIT7_9SPHN|nr:TadE/TadG family type IV pilus assembly protein [Parapontixanthobacter aurantiacus]MXO85629.1 hypothetical protein [Parapontixanthobacter aurantiacus]
MTNIQTNATARKLVRDERGVGLVELGFAAPVLMLLGLGMIDMSIVASSKVDMEQAAQRVTDFALSQRPTNGDASYLLAEAKEATGITDEALEADPSLIKVEIYLECSGERQTDFTTVCPVDEIPARFASVSVSRDVDTGFNWRGIGKMFSGSEGDPTIRVTGDSVVRFQ